MLRDFDLLVTTSRGNEGNTCYELRYLLEKMGISEMEINRTGISGLIVIRTRVDPFKIVERLREILWEKPYHFRYTLRIIPIENTVETDLENIRRAASQLASKIGEKETFRITVEKRLTELHRREIIEAVAANIERDVDLEKPDKILLIEVLDKLTGISVIEKKDIISVVKEKMR